MKDYTVLDGQITCLRNKLYDEAYQRGYEDAKEEFIGMSAKQIQSEVSEYDKDHIWYKGHQYISLRRFLEVKAEAEQEPTSPCDLCRFNPPSSCDGKPCTMCPAEKGGKE